MIKIKKRKFEIKESEKNEKEKIEELYLIISNLKQINYEIKEKEINESKKWNK